MCDLDSMADASFSGTHASLGTGDEQKVDFRVTTTASSHNHVEISSGPSSSVWVVLTVYREEDAVTQSQGKLSKTKKSKRETRAINDGRKSEDPRTPDVCSKETVVVPVSNVKVLPSVDKILNAAANNAKIIKKRELSSATCFLAMDADGHVLSNVSRINSDAEARQLLVKDGMGILILPAGGCPGTISDKTADALRNAQLDLYQKITDASEARDARQLARESDTGVSTSEKQPVLFWKDTDKNGYLSNWAKSSFRLQGHTFNCVEQYIMWSKANVMGDMDSEQQILSTQSPKQQKALGKKVHPWKEAVWKQHRQPVMLRAARAKFGQNEELRKRLLSTYPSRLAEASPSDTIYGIGLAPSDPLAQDPAKWKGANLLGCVLEQVRHEFLSLEADESVKTGPD